MTPEAMKLDVHIQGDKFRGFKNFAIMYRVYFRLMSTNVNTKVLSTLRLNSKEKIILLIEDEKPHVFTTKLLKWDEITIPKAIELQHAQSASHDQSKQVNNIEQIIEELDGRILLRFCSSRELTNLSSTSAGRKSFSNFHSDTSILTKKPQNYRFRSPIAEPIINDPPSPSSARIAYGCNALTNPNFTIQWPILKQDYYSTSNASKCKWFEQMQKNFIEKVKKEWIADIQELANSILLSVVRI